MINKSAFDELRNHRLDYLKGLKITKLNVSLENVILGSGVLGVVFRGVYSNKVSDQTFDEYVAVKVLDPKFWDDNKVRSAFIEEAKKNWDIKKKVESSNVVKIFSVGDFTYDTESDVKVDVPLMVLRLYQGSVEKFRYSLSEMEKLKFLEDVVGGLAEVFDKCGYVHGDLHPGNIFFDNGDFVVGDFGFANVSNLGESPYIKKSGEKSAYVLSSSMPLIDFFFPDKDLGFDFKRSDVFSVGANLIYLFLDSPLSTKGRNYIYEFINKKKQKASYKKIRDEFMSVMPEELSFLEEIVDKSFNPDKNNVFNDVVEMNSYVEELFREHKINYKKDYFAETKKKFFIEKSIEEKKIGETNKKSIKSILKKNLLGITIAFLIYASGFIGILYYKNRMDKEQNNQPTIEEKKENETGVPTEEIVLPSIENLLEKNDIIYKNYSDFNKNVKYAFSSSGWNKILQEYNKNNKELFTENQKSILEIITNSILEDWEIGVDYDKKDESTFPNPVMLTDDFVVFKIIKGKEIKYLALNIPKDKNTVLTSIADKIYGINEKNADNQTTKPTTPTTPPTSTTIPTTTPTTPTQTTIEDQLKDFNLVEEKELKKYSGYSNILYSGFIELLNENEFTRIISKEDLNKIKRLVDSSLTNGEIEKGYLGGDFGSREVIKNMGLEYENAKLIIQIKTDKLSQKLCSFNIGTENLIKMKNLLLSKTYSFRPILDLVAGWGKDFYPGYYDQNYFVTAKELDTILRNNNISINELFDTNKQMVLEKIMNKFEFDGEADSFILIENNLVANIIGPDYNKYNLNLPILPGKSAILKQAIEKYKNPIVVPQKTEIQKTLEIFDSYQESLQNYPNYQNAIEVLLNADLNPLKSTLKDYYEEIINNKKLKTLLDVLMDSNSNNGELEYLVVNQGSNNLQIFFKDQQSKIYNGLLSLDITTTSNLYNYAVAVNYVDSIKNSWESNEWLSNPKTYVQGTKCLSFKPNNRVFYLNGFSTTSEDAPFIYNGKAYVSLRTVSEALLAATSEISYGDGYPYFYRLKYNNHTYDFYLGTNTIIKDGYKITLSSGITLAGRTQSGFYIPITWFSELFNLNLTLNSQIQMYNLFVP